VKRRVQTPDCQDLSVGVQNVHPPKFRARNHFYTRGGRARSHGGFLATTGHKTKAEAEEQGKDWPSHQRITVTR
jgi:hypothetical protein